MKRDFSLWLSKFRRSIADYSYYTELSVKFLRGNNL